MTELALTFNQMLDRLGNSFNAQKQFVSNISHELRTPLAAIITELEVTAINERSPKEYKDMNGLVLEEACKLSRLSTDQPDARQGVLHANPDYGVELQFVSDIEEGDPIAIRGNEYLLKVAFANLMENACKFSAGRQCQVTIDCQQQCPVIAFKDNGIGLSLTARIVQLHQGVLEVQSERGQGTTFTIRLPRS